MTTPTARERMRRIWGQRNLPGSDDAMEREILAAERAAAEVMRERCARLNESMAAPFESDKRALASAAVLIRGLPLEGE